MSDEMRRMMILVERAAVLTDQSGFQAWFTGSKVVDRAGHPLVVYHSTSDRIEAFHPGTHFGTHVAANQRSADRGRKPGSHLIPVYLSIKNPLRVGDLHASDEACLLNAIVRGEYPGIDRGLARREGSYHACEAAGYDGLVYNNGVEHRGRLSWVVFHPQQVKSALTNTGAFDPTKPNMAEARTPSIAEAAENDGQRPIQVFRGGTAISSQGGLARTRGKALHQMRRLMTITEARQSQAEKLIGRAQELNRGPVRLALGIQDENSVNVEKLTVWPPEERGTGLATDAMKALCQMADRLSVTLYLEALPDEDEEGMDIDRLVGFYQRVGFMGGDGSGDRMMWRSPKQRKAR